MTKYPKSCAIQPDESPAKQSRKAGDTTHYKRRSPSRLMDGINKQSQEVIKMQSIKFGIMAVVNGELNHFHFGVSTAHPHAQLALKSWATYVSTEESNWIRGGKDFIFTELSECVGLFNTLMLIESESGENAPRMQFWKQVMNPIEFPKPFAPTVAA